LALAVAIISAGAHGRPSRQVKPFSSGNPEYNFLINNHLLGTARL
jgi:hypothetical protein